MPPSRQLNLLELRKPEPTPPMPIDKLGFELGSQNSKNHCEPIELNVENELKKKPEGNKLIQISKSKLSIADTEIHSPFRYAGGKFYARKLILECIPEHTYYCEPFTGGGSIFFAKPKSRYSWLNDLDQELVNTYRQIQDQPEKMIRLIDSFPPTKETHTYFKRTFKPKNDLERAARYFFLNRTSYSGIMKEANCYFGYGDKYSMRPENWLRNVLKCSEKLSNTKLSTLDFEKVIETAPDDAFLFIDPPYFNADQDKFYRCFFSNADHLRLEKVLRKHKNRIRFLITYDNTSEVLFLYRWAKSQLPREWNYTLNRTDDQKLGMKLVDGHSSNRYKGKEIFITNYSVNKSLLAHKTDEHFRKRPR